MRLPFLLSIPQNASIYTLFALFAIIILSCSDASICPVGESNEVVVKLAERGAIKRSQILKVQDENLCIRLDSVSNDSRCPDNADCIWAGSARVHFTLSKNSKQQSTFLETPNEQKMAFFEGYKIAVLGLKPSNRIGTTIAQDQYEAVFTVTK